LLASTSVFVIASPLFWPPQPEPTWDPFYLFLVVFQSLPPVRFFPLFRPPAPLFIVMLVQWRDSLRVVFHVPIPENSFSLPSPFGGDTTPLSLSSSCWSHLFSQPFRVNLLLRLALRPIPITPLFSSFFALPLVPLTRNTRACRPPPTDLLWFQS